MGFEPFDPFGEKDREKNATSQEKNDNNYEKIITEDDSETVSIPDDHSDANWDLPIIEEEVYDEVVVDVPEDQNSQKPVKEQIADVFVEDEREDSSVVNHAQDQAEKVVPKTPDQVPVNIIPDTKPKATANGTDAKSTNATVHAQLGGANLGVGNKSVAPKQKGRGAIYALLISILIISLVTMGLLGLGVYALLSVTSGYSDGYYSDFESDKVKLPEVKKVPVEGRAVPEFGQTIGSYSIDNNAEPTIAIKEAVGSAVVGIVGKIARKGSDEFRSGAGSGIVLSENGYIITNYHVISDADKLYVVFEGEVDEVPADLIGYDNIRDIAVIKVARNNLTAPIFGDSSTVKTGEMSVAIGNPLGTLNGTITQGIISASNRELTLETGRTQDFIQTDTAINPGNSGGALLNRNGEVIGINTRKETTVAIDDWGLPVAAEGIGYAIPINDALSIAEVLIREGRVERAQMGVTLKMITADMDEAKDGRPGIMVASVTRSGPADIAGIRKNDMILEIEDEKIEALGDISNLLDKKKIGEEIHVKVSRNDKELQYVVQLQDLSD